MSSGSIIIFGILSAVLLIFSCITLKATSYYNELETGMSTQLASKPALVLRNRSLETLKDFR